MVLVALVGVGGGDRLVGLAVWGRWFVLVGWVGVVAGCWWAGMRVCWRRGLGDGCCVGRAGCGLAVVWVGGTWSDAEAVKGGLVAGGWREMVSCTVSAFGGGVVGMEW